MAAIYDWEQGDRITEGLQGCRSCDQALHVARNIARDRQEPVLLEDDDGEWRIDPDGSAHPVTMECC